MNKLARVMASLCSIHEVDHRKLAEEHEVKIGEDLSREAEFVLTDPPYNVQQY